MADTDPFARFGVKADPPIEVKPEDLPGLGVVPVPSPDALAPEPVAANEDPFARFGVKADEPEPAKPFVPEPRELKVGREPISKPEAFVTRAGRAVSLGLTEPVSAAITAGLLDRIPGKETPSLRERYEYARQLQTERQKRIGKEQPGAAVAGTAAGTLASFALPTSVLAALGGTTGALEGKTLGESAALGALGAALPAGFRRLPKVMQATLPVGAAAADLATAEPGADTYEAMLNLGLMGATTGLQATRGVQRALSSRAARAGEQILSAKGAELAALREKELADAAAEVASAEQRRRQLTGEQQTRGSKILDLLRLGQQAGMTDLPSEESLMTPEGGWSPEALEEFKKSVRSFIVNSPEKFTSEPKRIAAALEEAIAAETVAQTKWTDPLAVAEAMWPVGPVTPGAVSPDLQEAARLLQQREIAAAQTRVPEEVKGSAKNRALAIGAANLAAYPFGLRSVPISAGTLAAASVYGAGRKVQQLVALDPRTKLFKDPAAANVVYDAIPNVVRKFPEAFRNYLSLATDKGIRARPAFLMLALQRDPDFARALEEEVTGAAAAP